MTLMVWFHLSYSALPNQWLLNSSQAHVHMGSSFNKDYANGNNCFDGPNLPTHIVLPCSSTYVCTYTGRIVGGGGHGILYLCVWGQEAISRGEASPHIPEWTRSLDKCTPDNAIVARLIPRKIGMELRTTTTTKYL